MIIMNVELYRFLKSKNINYLYHANTIGTSCTFIKNLGLLSRGAVEVKGLFQTSQKSDEEDKLYGVWNDIFLDVVNIHEYFPRQNLYGPVVFVFKTEMLIDPTTPIVHITKSNPMHWNQYMTESEKYYNNLNEYIEEFEMCIENKSIQSKMIIVKDTHDPLLFGDYLKEIILDNPGVKAGNTVFFNEAYKIIINTMKASKVPEELLTVKDCKKCSGCFCHKNYLDTSVDDLYRLFVKTI